MKKFKNPTQEFLFHLWIEEMVKAGFILQYEANLTPFVLFEGRKEEGITILNPTQYTPDGRIIWAYKAKGIFFITIDEIEDFKHVYFIAEEYDEIESKSEGTVETYYSSYLDVKSPPGSGGRNSSDASFIPKRSWMWDKFGIHINKVYNYPNDFVKKGGKRTTRMKPTRLYLWAHTFTPKRYLWTDMLTKMRSISKWKVVTLKEYLNEFKNVTTL